jgi:hypothetical protein
LVVIQLDVLVVVCLAKCPRGDLWVLNIATWRSILEVFLWFHKVGCFDAVVIARQMWEWFLALLLVRPCHWRMCHLAVGYMVLRWGLAP